MTEEQAAECLRQLRAHGHAAHLHPVTRRIAIWYRERWWHVAGGNFESPSLIAAKEPAPGPAPLPLAEVVHRVIPKRQG